MSKRDDLVPSGSKAKWTRASDYARGPQWRAMAPDPQPDPATPKRRISRRGLWAPVYVLTLGAAALWMSGAFDRSAPADPPAAGARAAVSQPAAAPATSSRGLVFGMCDQGGGTNCIVDGDTFYLAGKSVKVAGIEAPATHSAHCDAEALLGWAAAERLHSALNSGTVATAPVAPGHDGNGRLLRSVTVDGRDVGQLLVIAGLARPSEDGRRGWC